MFSLKKVMAKEDWYRDKTGDKQGLGGSQIGGKKKKIIQQFSDVHPLHKGRIADKVDEGERARVGKNHQV